MIQLKCPCLILHKRNAPPTIPRMNTLPGAPATLVRERAGVKLGGKQDWEAVLLPAPSLRQETLGCISVARSLVLQSHAGVYVPLEPLKGLRLSHPLSDNLCILAMGTWHCSRSWCGPHDGCSKRPSWGIITEQLPCTVGVSYLASTCRDLALAACRNLQRDVDNSLRDQRDLLERTGTGKSAAEDAGL
jgi:hypothetical protein